MKESSPVFRHWDMLRMIARHEMGIEEIADNLNVSTRTVRRDLVRMKQMGFLVQEKTLKSGRKVWHYDMGMDGTGKPFTYDEVSGLKIGSHFIKILEGTRLWEASRRGLEKICESLGHRVMLLADQMDERILLSDADWTDLRDKTGLIDTVISAMEDHKAIRVAGDKGTRAETETCVLDPYYLVCHCGTLFVMGRCHERNSLTCFDIHDLTSVEPQKQTFAWPPSEMANKKATAVFLEILAQEQESRKS